ncbi:MAG TPA: hypothetical protein VFZ65_16300 [Planctomycetota bacterium]|nr:hypothetical protein [Planctomycetota bacterium]
MTTRPLPLPLLLLAATTAHSALAQSNTVPGLDIKLEDTSQIQRYRRTGSFPNGVQAIGMYTVCCNPGSVAIPFQAAMNANHGFIHYIVARESGGRLVQISNYAWVKHTFGSNNNPSSCGVCINQTTSSFVEPGCNDTYANSQAVDHFNLGPPGEVDPWLGAWNPICSLFDRGNPEVTLSQQCDGIRSLTHTQANVLNAAIGDAMRVYDDDLNVPGATFYYQSGYLVPGEAEANRGNNIGSRRFTPTYSSGSGQWNFSDGPTYVLGSILQQWSGASVDSAPNGTDDGRYYVAVKVTGPNNGLYHYEYAVQNRDNKRGMGAFRLPVCPEAQVLNFGFHDFDRNPLSDWVGAKVGAEIVFQSPPVTANPLRWNSIFNFWFDSDAAPLPGTVLLDQYDIGPGALTVSVASSTPSGVFNQNLGPGCGNPAAPTLYATGTPDRALLGNATFALRSGGNPGGALCAFLLSTSPGTTPIGPGCTAYTGNPLSMLGPVVALADGSGFASLPLPVPNDPALEGSDLDFQMLTFVAGGPVLGTFNLSNGLRIRVGSLTTGCP